MTDICKRINSNKIEQALMAAGASLKDQEYQQR
jgi:hypothetical protein